MPKRRRNVNIEKIEDEANGIERDETMVYDDLEISKWPFRKVSRHYHNEKS